MNITTSIITGVIALAAIISPVIVNLIESKNQMKIKKMEYSHSETLAKIEKITDIYDRYFEHASKVIISSTRENMNEYRSAYALALVYMPPKANEQLVQINELIIKGESEQANACLEGFAEWMAPLMKQFWSGCKNTDCEGE